MGMVVGEAENLDREDILAVPHRRRRHQSIIADYSQML